MATVLEGGPTPTSDKTSKRRHEAITTPESGNKRSRMTTAAKSDSDDDLFKKITAHFDSTTEEFKKSFNKQFEEVNSRVGENSKEIREIKQATKRIEQNRSATPQTNNPTQGPASTRVLIDSQLDKRQEKFDTARRSLRIWPVNGKDEKVPHSIRRIDPFW